MKLKLFPLLFLILFSSEHKFYDKEVVKILKKESTNDNLVIDKYHKLIKESSYIIEEIKDKRNKNMELGVKINKVEKELQNKIKTLDCKINEYNYIKSCKVYTDSVIVGTSKYKDSVKHIYWIRNYKIDRKGNKVYKQ